MHGERELGMHRAQATQKAAGRMTVAAASSSSILETCIKGVVYKRYAAMQCHWIPNQIVRCLRV